MKFNMDNHEQLKLIGKFFMGWVGILILVFLVTTIKSTFNQLLAMFLFSPIMMVFGFGGLDALNDLMKLRRDLANDAGGMVS